MYYDNKFALTTKDNKSATKALEALKKILLSGFECDSTYKFTPSSLLLNALFVEENKINVPKDFYCSLPEDSERVFNVLLKSLSEIFEEDFICETYSYCDYSECAVSANHKNGTLKIIETYYPSGYCESVYCEECDIEIPFNIHNPDEHIICPECGEEIDLSECLAVVTECVYSSR